MPITRKKRKTIALCAALAVMLFIMICREFLVGYVPLLMFNLSSDLQLPGSIIMLLVVLIFSPQNAWQAVHEVSSYRYASYAINFAFYFPLTYAIQAMVAKMKKEL
jgi:hypothetical protein